MKRFLTQREAERCENAIESACKCRCNGAKHGAARVQVSGDFSTLPSDDPHYLPTVMSKGEIRKMLRHAEDHLCKFYREDDWSPRMYARVLIEQARQLATRPAAKSQSIT